MTNYNITVVRVDSLKHRENGLFEATAKGNTDAGRKVMLAIGREDIYLGH